MKSARERPRIKPSFMSMSASAVRKMLRHGSSSRFSSGRSISSSVTNQRYSRLACIRCESIRLSPLRRLTMLFIVGRRAAAHGHILLRRHQRGKLAPKALLLVVDPIPAPFAFDVVVRRRPRVPVRLLCSF